jgi:hypothetical protein
MLVEKYKIENWYYTRRELQTKWRTRIVNNHGDLVLTSKDGKHVKNVRSEMVEKGRRMA